MTTHYPAGASDAPDSSVVRDMKPGMIQFSNGGDLPSYVSPDGTPFMFAGRPLVVKKINPSSSTAVVSLFSKKGDDLREYAVRWSTAGPVLLQGFLIRADKEEDDDLPFGGKPEKPEIKQETITLITIDGVTFDIPVGIANPIITGSPESMGIYYTVREDGNRRHVKETGTSNNYLAEFVNNEWKIMLAQDGRNQHLNINDSTSLTGKYFISDTGILLEYKMTDSQGHWRSFEPAKSLDFGARGDIFGVTYNRQTELYSGTLRGKTITFAIDLSGGLKIPHMELNGNIVFLDKNGQIIFTENIDRSIDPAKKIENLPGFPGVTLYGLKSKRNDREVRYTDGKSVFFLVEKEGIIQTYPNSGSQYEGCAVSGVQHYGGTGCNAHYSGEKGVDYEQILTAAGEVLLLPGKEGERVVNPDQRSEVPTTLAQKMNDGFTVVGLHPDKSIIVLQPKGGDSTSSYRYYGIDKEGNLTYIGSKINNGETQVGVFNAIISGHGKTKAYPICLGDQGESRAFMLGDITFLPVLIQNNQAALLCLTSDAYRDLHTIGNLPIPKEWIVDGKIKHGSNLESLIEKFPGTDTPHIPGKIYFSDIYGREFTPSNLDQAPKLAFGDSRYYVVKKGGSVYLWSPESDSSISIPTIHRDGDHDEEPRLPEKISRGKYQAYIYPANSEFPENLRMALFVGNGGVPISSYVWYDPKGEPTIKPLKDNAGRSQMYQEHPKIQGNYMIFNKNGETHIYVKNTGEAALVPSYPGLRLGVNSGGEVVHNTPNGPVQYSEEGKPRMIEHEGRSWYVLEERGSYEDWNPGKEAEEVEVLLCYHVATQKILPFRLEDGKYIPVLALNSIEHSTSVNPQGNLVYIGTNILKNDEVVYCLLRTVSQLSGDKAEEILIHEIIFESSNYAIGYGRTSFEMARGKQHSLYLMYMREKNTFCVKINEKVIRNRDSSISINGVPFQVEDDTELLNAWMDGLAEKYLPKDSTPAIISGKAEEVGRVIEKK